MDAYLGNEPPCAENALAVFPPLQPPLKLNYQPLKLPESPPPVWLAAQEKDLFPSKYLTTQHEKHPFSANKFSLSSNDLNFFPNLLNTCQLLVCSLIPLLDAIATKREAICGYSQLRHLAKKKVICRNNKEKKMNHA